MQSKVWIELPQFKFVKVKTPYPAHRTCAQLMIHDQSYQKWTMVHGFIYKKIGKKIFFRSYAWFQKGGKVYDVATGTTVSKKSFYAKFRPEGVLTYSFKEVRHNMAFYRRYGNWVEGTGIWPAGTNWKF